MDIVIRDFPCKIEYDSSETNEGLPIKISQGDNVLLFGERDVIALSASVKALVDLVIAHRSTSG